MRNFISKILLMAPATRLSPVPGWSAGAFARERLPFLLLLAALAAAILSWIADGRFDTLRLLDGQSMAVASNLSPEHRFLMFFSRHTDADGELLYSVYNRFPIGTYLLIKAVIAPFGDSTSAQIFAARLLTAALFSGAAAFAYLGLRRLTNQPWIALAATLLTFSSYHFFSYGDMISSEMNGVFGMMLTFHGMTIFAQEGRFRQLLIKAFIAILIDWTVMALLLPFTTLGLASAVFRAMREGPPSLFTDKAGAAFAAFVSSRFLWLGAASLLFCALVMGFNIANEYIALGGEVPLLDLPSVQSMLARAVIGEGLPRIPRPGWLPLIDLQIERIGGVSLPYLILPALGYDAYDDGVRSFGFWVGVAVSAGGLASLAFTRHRGVAASLLLAGWIWALAVRGGSIEAAHEYEALYYIGVPLVIFATFLTAISRRIKWSAIGAAAAALIVFGVSMLQFARFADFEDPSRTAANSDLKAIREITQGASVCVGPMRNPWGVFRALDYYLAGGVLNYTSRRPCSFGADAAERFIVAPAYAESDALLTPNNKIAFLYDARRLQRLPQETALKALSSQEPVIKSIFSVYLDDGVLVYAKEPCSDLDARDYFSLRARPVNDADLPPSAGRDDSELFYFRLNERGARFDDACLGRVVLPDYPIERIRTGQFDDEGELWSAFYVFDDAVYRAASAKAALAEPDARNHFNLYLHDDKLLFLRDPCEPSDADARFFIHAQPVDPADLPQDRKDYGFDNLNFNFDEQGAIFDGKCAAIVDLPAYPVERIRFGQFDGDVEIWGEVFVLDDMAYRSALAEAAFSEPVARNHFDLYLQDDSLLFLRGPCAPSDTDARFFVHVHPVNGGDLPRERREHGFDNLDFRFDERGLRVDGKCAAIAYLPAYPIERIRAGQLGGEGVIWQASLAPGERG